jgi:uncharacterized protein
LSELPEGLGTERVFIIRGTYAPDAAERRVPVRAEHLTRVAAGVRDGRVVMAGAYDDMRESLLLLRADDEAGARAWADADIYGRSGVWVSVEVLPFNLIVVDDGAP